MKGSVRKHEKPARKTPTQAQTGASQPFSFGPRRYASKGARRLFAPQKSLISPAFELPAERPRTILRVVSTSM